MALLVGGAILFALLGYALGSSRTGTRLVTGSVQVGDRVATMTGTGYGVRASTPWIDVGGVMHESGWPDCLGDAAPETLPVVRFAVTQVDYPDGTGLEQVVYVDCRP